VRDQAKRDKAYADLTYLAEQGMGTGVSGPQHEPELVQDEIVYAELLRQLSPRARALVKTSRPGRRPQVPDPAGRTDETALQCCAPPRTLCEEFPGVLAMWCIPLPKRHCFILRRVLRMDVGEIASCLALTHKEVTDRTNRAMQPYHEVLAYVLRDWQQRDDETIAAALGIDPSQVEYYVNRGRRKLHDQLEEVGGFHA
jgi:hypothetical protein